MGYTPDLRFDHMGVNCADGEQAAACADRFALLFGIPRDPDREGAGSCYSGAQIEWMKGPGPGERGHIALATADLPGARAWLEERGFTFDDATAKYFSDGRMMVIYAREQIGGFAIHLVQR